MSDDLTPAIRAALAHEPDYSEAFTRRVSELAEHVSGIIGVKAGHTRAMNYRAGQSIEVELKGNGVPVDAGSDDPLAKLLTFISSRGPLFAFAGLKLVRPRTWAPEEPDKLPGASTLMKRIAIFLEARGYERVDGSMLNRIVEGKTTEMDDAPATLMQVLFAELI